MREWLVRHPGTSCLLRLELDVPVGSELSLQTMVQLGAACQPCIPSAGGAVYSCFLLTPRPYVSDESLGQTKDFTRRGRRQSTTS